MHVYVSVRIIEATVRLCMRVTRSLSTASDYTQFKVIGRRSLISSNAPWQQQQQQKQHYLYAMCAMAPAVLIKLVSTIVLLYITRYRTTVCTRRLVWLCIQGARYCTPESHDSHVCPCASAWYCTRLNMIEEAVYTALHKYHQEQLVVSRKYTNVLYNVIHIREILWSTIIKYTDVQ